MGGSQLKRLKATLLSKGLTGQTNVKKKGSKKNSRNAPVENRRDEKERLIKEIREEFNPFEIKVNRKKHDIQDSRSSKSAVGRPGISKQIGEEERKAAYEHRKSRKNKVGALVDRRFGENDPTMSLEDKMLERFTKEKQRSTTRKSLFNLDDDDEEDEDDENGGFQLTHYGQSLGDDTKLTDDDDATLASGKRASDDSNQLPPRKKTKAEVMKEVIAKSKFYKHERQKQQANIENQISELNEGFDDVMSELRGSAAAQVKSNGINSKSEKDIEYTQQMRKLNLERRAAPTERTKTDEELKKERLENQKKLEEARLRRMEGLDRDEAIGDDLDEEFWEKNSEEEDNASGIELSQEEIEEEGSEEESTFKRPKNKSIASLVRCPATHEEFLQVLEGKKDVVGLIRTILSTYKLNLAAENKNKLGVFSQVIVDHILYLANSNLSQRDYVTYVETQEQLIKILKQLATKFVVPITNKFRELIASIGERLLESIEVGNNGFPRTSDMMFFILVGVLYSTSDHYHLVVTPAVLLMCQSINQLKITSLTSVAYGLFICDLLLEYQRLAKRFIPEVASFLESVLLVFYPDVERINFKENLTVTIPRLAIKKPHELLSLPKDIADSEAESVLKISDINNANGRQLFIKAIGTVDKYMTVIWKEKTAFVEISNPFIMILSNLSLAYKPLENLVAKLEKLRKFAIAEHKPLKLQGHRPIAIATYAPKFEENFNPEKKSYDPDRQRQEISKMKAQIKKERKLTVREFRKDNKFMAREQIKETKAKYADYHSKMASIINSINTIEGNERNQYEKERRRRKDKK